MPLHFFGFTKRIKYSITFVFPEYLALALKEKRVEGVTKSIITEQADFLRLHTDSPP